MSAFQKYMIFYSSMNLLGTFGICKLIEYDNKQIALKKLSQNKISN